MLGKTVSWLHDRQGNIAPRRESTLLVPALSMTHRVTLDKPMALSGPQFRAATNDDEGDSDGGGGPLFLSAYFLQALF